MTATPTSSHPPRRIKRTIAIVFAILPLCSPILAAQAPAPSGVADRYDIVPVAKGVYAFVAPHAYGGIVNGNSTLVIGDSIALVVDAGHFPALTRKMIADIRRLTDRPVRYLVNSHWHSDHWMGNSEFRIAYPDVAIVSTRFTHDEMVKEWPATKAAQYTDTAAIVPRLRTVLKRQLPDDLRRYYEAMLADLPAASVAWRGLSDVYPNRLFDTRLVIDLGGRTAEVLFLGGGNTAGDAVVFVPDAKVVATGDLVVAPTPYAYPPAHAREWIATLGRLTRLGADVYVPGHGPVEHDTSYVHLIVEALTTLDAQVRSAVARGLDLKATQAAVDLSAIERQFTRGDPSLAAQFHIDFVTPAVQQAFTDAAAPSIKH
jgi:glyoxylase-like metal-dependent hydrolase (beta-lactamase superfamily II)